MTLQRTESFVPLSAAPAAGRGEFRVTVIPRAEQPQPFQSLESAAFSNGGTPPPPGKRIHEPRISVQRNGDQITNLRIQCSCGQVMDVACVYDEPPKQP
jgi:hypothetical protein